MGSYPVKLDKKNPEHLKIKKAFINTLYGLRYTMPCSICRNSYKDFWKVNNIEKYTGSRKRLMYWLYLMKNMVNLKLGTGTVPFKDVIKFYLPFAAGTCSIQAKSCK
jgi:hypothetical protein